MAKSVNKVILLGYLGKDPELKYTQRGDVVLSFSIATSESWKDKSGEWQEKTEWHNIVQFKASEKLAENLSKGSRVYVEGKLTTQSWEDKRSNETKYKTQIVASQIIILGESSGSDRSERQGRNEQGARANRRLEREEIREEISDADIPF